jgi:hypothetical protein
MAAWREDMPPPDEGVMVRELMRALSDLFNTKSGTLGRYIVDVFGSTSWGGALLGVSDIDMVVIVS